MKHLFPIEMRAIAHNEQRYKTPGDYFKKSGKWQIRVSRMSKPQYEFFCSMHEAIELFLTQLRGIGEAKIKAFDLANINHPDPGRLKNAPYHREHMFSMKIEKLLCKECGIQWKDYDSDFDRLVYRKGKK